MLNNSLGNKRGEKKKSAENMLRKVLVYRSRFVHPHMCVCVFARTYDSPFRVFPFLLLRRAYEIASSHQFFFFGFVSYFLSFSFSCSLFLFSIHRCHHHHHLRRRRRLATNHNQIETENKTTIKINKICSRNKKAKRFSGILGIGA